MSAVSDLLSLLDKVPIWKNLSSLPAKMAALEMRLADIEKKMAGGGDICPRCKQPTFSLVESKPDENFGDLGAQKRTYRCSNCDLTESKVC